MIKLIATDMDGTLLNSHNEIDPSFYPMVDELNKKNIIFAAASGRQYYNLLERFQEVKEKMLFIAENGTYVVYKNEELLVNGISRKAVDEFIALTAQIPDCYIVLCGKKAAYIVSDEPRFMEQFTKYYARYELVESFEQVEDEILKFTICDFRSSEKNSNLYFEKYREAFQVTVSGEYWLDITAQGANKGVAIKAIQDRMAISFEETMVFGDYLNDVEMMQSAYYSYAMANAHPDLKKVSRFVTKSNDENGVVDTITQKVLKS